MSIYEIDSPFRECRTCKKTLPRGDFYVTTKQIFTECKACTIERTKVRYRKKFPEKKQRDSQTDDKRCPDCEIVKSYTEFAKSAYHSGGRLAYCHSCKRIRNQRSRAKHIINRPLQVKQSKGRVFARDPMAYYAKELTRRAYNRSIKLALPFDIDAAYVRLLLTTICPVLGIPLDYTGTGKKMKGDAPSLDRIDPLLGYVRGNVAVISWRANRIKCDATPEEAMRVALWMQSFTQKNLKVAA